ncbi:DUF4129 domain-containing protein [Paenibacillus sp. MMS18-CY102]|uniref:DUF4129 domain-containing protein n=1 Tax=Paenibacillus sp. MMS18-CY102 TaxID=2682849 RepID=UPI00136616C2|nr:DUF4129 domain-containing protein [Paenibacillus sp. MMS18-CY102]MWC28076.1 DUF4129 domain-containing protein [Paenibacillus sp. MMS18-CY102]
MMQASLWQHPAARTVLRGLLVLLLFLPIAVCFARLALPVDLTVRFLILIPFVHIAGQTIERILGRNGRWLTVSLVILIVFALSFRVFGLNQAGVLIAMAYGFFGIHGTLLPPDGRVTTLPVAMYLMALLLNLISPILLYNDEGSTAYVPFVNAIIAITVLACLFIWNSRHLEREAHPDQKESGVARSIVWHNRLLVAGMGAIVLFLALLPALSEGMRRIFALLLEWLSELFSSTEGKPAEHQQATMQSPQSLLEGKPNEPGLSLLFLERIMSYFVVIMISILATWAIYKLVRAMPGLARFVQRWLQRVRGREKLAATAAGYEDEMERIEPNAADKRRAPLLGRLFRNKNGEEWSSLADNAARIRYLYKTALQNRSNLGYTVKPQLTPRETAEELAQEEANHLAISQDIINLYEGVRYGERAVTDEEAAVARQLEQKPPKR